MTRTPCSLRAAWLSGFIACMLFMLTPVSHAQQGYGKPGDPVAADVIGIEIRTSNPGEMAYVIKQMLTANYAKMHNLQATNAEIEQFVAGKQEADNRVRKEVEARYDEVQKALQSETLPDEERTQLESELSFCSRCNRQSRMRTSKTVPRTERRLRRRWPGQLSGSGR